ncbi:MAG TPA: hypothetical protein VFO19_21190 [Vicinamibacterales bacterium]|nr:hypothetical protein [Vicinamibacterales bacterium]
MKKAATFVLGVAIAVATGAAMFGGGTEAKSLSITSSKFSGAKANTGMVTYAKDGAKHTLTLSDDFKTPDTPDPHWMVIDANGTTYLLDRLMLKGDRLSKTITLPAYINNVAKVEIYCAWAEANLGEAAFATPVSLK